jgi:hypothetical protein
MFNNKSHFLEYQFPNAGMFYEDKNCNTSLFIGQLEIFEGKMRIKILERVYNSSINCYETLYAKLTYNKNYEIVAWSFFNCEFKQDISYDFINFESFAKHSNGNMQAIVDIPNKNSDLSKRPIPEFITEDSKFKKISLYIDGFEEWLWRQPLSLGKEDFSCEYIKKNGEVQSWMYKLLEKGGSFDEDIIRISIPYHTMHKKIEIDDKITLELHSEPSLNGEYPNFEVSQTCHIDIITKKAYHIDFFYKVINKLLLFFTLIGSYGKCKIHKISSFEKMSWKTYRRVEFYNKYLRWDVIREKNDYWFVDDNMLYHTIQLDFHKAIKSFFDNNKNFLHNIINFVCDMNAVYTKEYLEVYLSQQVQMLEIYGNIKLKGEYPNGNGRENTQDLREAIFSQIPDTIFDKIFVHNYINNNDYRGWKNFGENRNKDILHLKEFLFSNLTILRNFIIHPCKEGSYKKLSKTELAKHYYMNDTTLNLDAIASLSFSLKMLLRWFLYREIGLEKYFKI